MFVYKDFAFYHMNKCGGTSIKKILKQLNLKFKQIGKGHYPLSSKKCDLNKYRIYTNIRNPYHRIVSMYEFGKQVVQGRYKDMPENFKDFFYNCWLDNKKDAKDFYSQQKQLFVGGTLPENLSLIKLEEIGKHWPEIIKQHFNVEISFIPKMNTTMHGDPMKYFDEEMIEQVRQKEQWAVKQYNL